MMWDYFIGSSKIKTVDSAQRKNHQSLFLVRGWGLGTRLALFMNVPVNTGNCYHQSKQNGGGGGDQNVVRVKVSHKKPTL